MGLALVVLFGSVHLEAARAEGFGQVRRLAEIIDDIQGALAPTDDALLARPMLGRPTDTSVTISIINAEPMMFYVEYGTRGGEYEGATDTLRALAGGDTVPSTEIVVSGLAPNTGYHYRIMCRGESGGDFREADRGNFRTQRARGSSFTFTIQADSHIHGLLAGHGFDRGFQYTRTIENALSDAPDFHIDMGDFAGVEWYTRGSARTVADAMERYLLQRLFLGRIATSAPFYLVLGNHEGEEGWRRTNKSDDLEVIGTCARKALIPNPAPDGFYTGSSEETEGCGLRENYYAWEWGDALFVVLDPFWNTMRMPHRTGGYEASLDAWDWTLGRAQYEWLYETLHSSGAAWKFVFAHHMTGGYRYRNKRIDPYGRGGIAVAKHKVAGQPSFEWGGEDSTGRYVFDEKRPGWPHGPIHDMMAREGVDIFFHGHDHVFVYETLDGIVYQACPQAASGKPSAGFYSPAMYVGSKVNNSGHLRVAVTPDSVRVDYVRSVLPEDEPLVEGGAPVMNGDVSYSYVLVK